MEWWVTLWGVGGHALMGGYICGRVTTSIGSNTLVRTVGGGNIRRLVTSWLVVGGTHMEGYQMSRGAWTMVCSFLYQRAFFKRQRRTSKKLLFQEYFSFLPFTLTMTCFHAFLTQLKQSVPCTQQSWQCQDGVITLSPSPKHTRANSQQTWK